MKKIVIATAAALASSMAFAGGLLTNTNQNAAFLRQMSQDATIDITGLYFNPAGTAFLSNGWHLSLNAQSAFQTRTINTTFPLFAMNTATPGIATHEFKGVATAPVIPSFQLSYNHDKWSVNASFSLGGGGGKCEFDKGLGSFEALYAGKMAGLVPEMVNAKINPMMPMVAAGVQQTVAGEIAAGLIGKGVDPTTAAAQGAALAATGAYTANPASSLSGYGLDAYMKGRQYYFGLQLGATYKITDDLAVFGGIRGVYASNNYNGYVQDVKASYTAAAYYTCDVPAAGIQSDGTMVLDKGSQDLNDNTLTLNCDQTAFGITPIVGIDWRINKHWNVAAKYEFKTRMRLKNKTEMNNFAKAQVADGNATLAQFEDGKKVAGDIPGILNLGAMYSPIEKVRLNAGFHYYLDQDATSYGNKQELIDKNTWEVNAGAEWDICKWITVSGSWQRTKYGLSDAYMNDLSFNLSNHSMGVGVRVNATERCSIDLGYMHTFYQDRTVNTATAAGIKSDLYSRTNNVFGLGVNLNF